MHYLRLSALVASTTLATAATAQDVSTLSAVDVLKLQVGAGQTADQLEEQLADQLTFNAEDQFDNRSQVKTYAQQLAQQGMTPAGLSGALPVRELTYDFELKTYKICLPSSILYKTQTEGGMAEALISFEFDGLADKDAETCPFYKTGFIPGGALGVSNYMEIEVDMATAQKLHNAIEAETSMASFTCDEVRYIQGRFDTGPTQLRCTATSVDISSEGGAKLSYDAADSDDSWITNPSAADSGGGTLEMSADSGNATDGAGSSMEVDPDDTQAASDAAAAAAAAAALAALQPPTTEGTILTETALELDRTGRIQVQRRLNLLGYDTRGVDGVFGPGTRAGITQWQYKNGMPPTGYLAADQLAVLNTTSETLYQNWLAANANSSSTTSSTKKSSTRRKYYRGSDGCLRTRRSNARRYIVPGQSRYCNQRRRGKR